MQDLKANESRLRDINKVAAELESEGLMAEEAPMVQAQVCGCSSKSQTHTFKQRHKPHPVFFLWFCSSRSYWGLLLERFLSSSSKSNTFDLNAVVAEMLYRVIPSPTG